MAVEKKDGKAEKTMPEGVLAMDENGRPTAYIGEYQGKKTLTLTRWTDDSRRGARPFDFTFGKAKAEMILHNAEVIKKFLSL